MHFYCDLARTQIRGNLFVWPTRDHERKHLSLTRCQRIKALPQHSDLQVLFESDAVMLQRSLDRIQKFLIAEWLRQELNGSGLHGLDGHWDVTVAGNKGDRNMNVGLGQLTLEIKATPAGQPDV